MVIGKELWSALLPDQNSGKERTVFSPFISLACSDEFLCGGKSAAISFLPLLRDRGTLANYIFRV